MADATLESMTMTDLGPERPGPASSTRQMVEMDRAGLRPAHVSGRVFWIVLAVILIGLGAFALLR